MKVCQTLLCFIFLNLQDGNTGLANAETLVYGVEGGNITVECKFYIPGRKTLFCKDKCEKGNILIETADYTAQSGRYSIKYEKSYFSKDIVHVSITQLKKSDAGWYRCTLDTSVQPCDFQLVITGASTTTTQNFNFHDTFSRLRFLLAFGYMYNCGGGSAACCSAAHLQKKGWWLFRFEQQQKLRTRPD
ncbi:unnamed protein product [Oreochromis niloticus]|nr:unnamed protein product [Mustela putorius furo]